MASIQARGLRKAFGTTIALDGVDLRVEEGRILGLIGPNGAGKTTALDAILGLTYKGDLTILRDLMQAGKVTPVIDRTYKLSEASQAIRYLEEGHARGKVVITVEHDNKP
ncbi:MAG TPA: hypothetical protein DHU55_03610 [Blastocatellia bacterium]|nr:hypothetical protein [Blastocatellia bacterium]